MAFVIPSYFSEYFLAFTATLVSSLAGRMTLEIFVTIMVSLVELNNQISFGCLLLAFVLGFGLDAVSVV